MESMPEHSGSGQAQALAGPLSGLPYAIRMPVFDALDATDAGESGNVIITRELPKQGDRESVEFEEVP